MTVRPVAPLPNAQRLMAELEFLSELCAIVASNAEMQPILDWIVQKTTQMLAADEGSIRILAPEESAPALRTIIRKESPGIQANPWPRNISLSVMGFLTTYNEGLATPDLVDDARFPGLRGAETRVRAVLAAPLKVGNRFTGMLAVMETRPGRQWTADEQQLLTIVASNSAGVLEQARLRTEALEMERLEEQQRRYEHELGLAREIQMNLVPCRALLVPPWETVGRIVPARQVGGDAFDFFVLGDDRFAMAIADVSGKGVPAALLMSNLQASLRAFCDGKTPIPQAIDQVNRSVLRSAAPGKFITVFYAEIDTRRNVLRYTNAGHNYPLLRRADGTVVDLTDGGLPLGILDDATYAEAEVPLLPGDSVLLYSDGITEALNTRGEEFGDERLRELWARDGHGEPAAMVDHILDQVQKFRGHAVQNDDMTLVVARAAGSS